MKNLFETSAIEFNEILLSGISCCKTKGESVNILDWTEGVEKDDAYFIFSSTFFNEQECLLPINVDTLEKNADYMGNIIRFQSIDQKQIKKNHYDFILLRPCSEISIPQTIKTTSEALVEGGILYFNLLKTKYIKEIINEAKKNDLYPIGFSNFQFELNRPEYTGEWSENEFKKLIDTHGYLLAAFQKKQRKFFSYSVITDKKYYEVKDNDKDVFLLQLAAVHCICDAITLSHKKELPEFNEDLIVWVESRSIIEIENINEYIDKLNNPIAKIQNKRFKGGIYPESEKILFSDYFEVNLPHHTKISELDPNEYYYLSPSLSVHYMADNYFNHEDTNLPELLLRQINFSHLGNVYSIIDINGNVFENSKQLLQVRNQKLCITEIENLYLDEKNSIELHSLNNISEFNIDILSTLLYNLIRIKPTKNISLDYIKMFFHTNQLEETLYRISNSPYLQKRINNSINQNRIDDIISSQNYNLGYIALIEFCEHHCDLNDNSDFYTYSAEDVRNAYIFVDKYKNHKELIKNFASDNEGIEQYRVKVSERFSEAAFIKDLKKREEQVRNNSQYSNNTFLSLIKSQDQLVQGELLYDACSNLKSDVDLQNFYKALEIYLRLCIACCANIDRIKYNPAEPLLEHLKTIDGIGTLTFGELSKIFQNKDNKNYLFKENIDLQKYDAVTERLKKFKNYRNKTTHRGDMIKTDEAEKIIEEIYETLIFINEMLIN